MIDEIALQAWFVREVLPLERGLVRFIARNWRVADEVNDIRQDVYALAIAGAAKGLPANAGAYVYTIARNQLINRTRRANVVLFEQLLDLENPGSDVDLYATERALNARDELRRALAGIERLSPRCREIVTLRKVDGLTPGEIAERLGTSEGNVHQQIKMGMKALADFMSGGDGRIDWKGFVRRKPKESRQ